MPKLPQNESFVEWLGYMVQIMNRNCEEFPFVVNLLNSALIQGGLRDEQEQWARRMIYPTHAVLKEIGLWPPPQKKPVVRREGNVIYLNRAKD